MAKTAYHHGNLRESLLDAAARQLETGTAISNLSLRSLAQELGVSNGAPYRHFRNFEALVAALAERAFAQLQGAMEERLSEASPGGSLQALGEAYVTFALRQPRLYRTMFHLPAVRVPAYPALQSASAEVLKMLSRGVQEHGRAIGGLRLSQDEALLACWAYVHGLADLGMQRLSPQLSSPDDDAIKRLASAMVQGL